MLGAAVERKGKELRAPSQISADGYQWVGLGSHLNHTTFMLYKSLGLALQPNISLGLALQPNI